MTLCKPWMTHKSQKASFQWGPFKKSMSLILIKLKQKILAKTFAVEISQIMSYNNAQV